MPIVFKDFSQEVIDKINACGVAWLEEASGAVEGQTKKNTKVDTGKTKGSWEHIVHDHKLEAEVGSRYKNAIWEEFGTGIYALNGDGRKTKWVYTPDGQHFYTTVGKKPRRPFHNAYSSLKNKLIISAQRKFENL